VREHRRAIQVPEPFSFYEKWRQTQDSRDCESNPAFLCQQKRTGVIQTAVRVDNNKPEQREWAFFPAETCGAEQ
jgi:hypothetical protein